MRADGCCGEVALIASVRVDAVYCVGRDSECGYFRVYGYFPPALARAEFKKDQLFSLLEGEQGHPGTETRDLVLSAEDRTCPLLGL